MQHTHLVQVKRRLLGYAQQSPVLGAVGRQLIKPLYPFLFWRLALWSRGGVFGKGGDSRVCSLLRLTLSRPSLAGLFAFCLSGGRRLVGGHSTGHNADR